MQQTENYKLNLIDTGDPFSPEPLNHNMAVLDAALGTGGTTARIVTGSYVGDGTRDKNKPNTLDFADTLGCAPKLLYIVEPGTNCALFLTPQVTFRASDGMNTNCTVIWSETGVSWYSINTVQAQMNRLDVEYYYVAIA